MTEHQAPIRLVDDPNVEAGLKNALEELSTQESGFDTAAGLSRLQSAISAPEASARGSASSGALAVGAVACVVALVGAGAYLSRSGGGESSVPGETSSQPPLVASAQVTAAAPSASPVRPPAPSARLPPAPEPSAVVQPSTPTSGSAKKRAPPDDRAQRRRDEIAHLVGVRRLSNCPGVVRAVDQGHQRFRGGVLYQEREFLAISCLARSGSSAAARGRGQAFLRAFPTSPFAPQVRSTIGTK